MSMMKIVGRRRSGAWLSDGRRGNVCLCSSLCVCVCVAAGLPSKSVAMRSCTFSKRKERE